MAIHNWSKTAASNATADASINWAEGQLPSTVNDSARAMMKAIADWRDDISGALVTAGTSSAYTVTTNAGTLSAPGYGQMIAITVNSTNAASATLSVDSGTAYPIYMNSTTPIQAGVLVGSTAYTLRFDTTIGSGVWLLRDYYGIPYAAPIGGIIPYVGSTSPNSNFVIPRGQAISRTTYATLYALVGTTYGVGDGSTTFNVPNYNGVTMVQTGSGYGVAATLGQFFGEVSHTLTQAELPNVALSVTASGSASVTGTQQTLGSLSVANLQGGGAAVVVIGAGVTLTSTGTASVTGTTSALGSGNAFNNCQPSVGVNYLMRVL